MGEEKYNGVADALASVEYIQRRRAQQRPPPLDPLSLTEPGAVVLAFPERHAPEPLPVSEHESDDIDPGAGAMIGATLGLLMWGGIFLTRCSLAWLFS